MEKDRAIAGGSVTELGSTQVMAALLSFLLLALLPAQAAPASSQSLSGDPPEIGAEFPVSEPTVGLDFGSPDEPAVASNGSDFLAVWFNENAGRTVRGVRVTAAGEVLDVGGLRIGVAGEGYTRPEIAWDGTNYIVVWSDFGQILASRVSSQGTVLDQDPIVISRRSSYAWAPTIAGSSSGSLVVWEDDGDIWGARVDPQGNVMEEAIRVSGARRGQWRPAVAWSGSEFLVTWEDQRSGQGSDIFAARVAADGTLLDARGVPISTAAGKQSRPSVSWTGGEFRLVWQDRRPEERLNIYSGRVDADANVLPPEGLPVAESAVAQSDPDISSEDGTSVVAWKTGSGLEAVSIDEETLTTSATQMIAPSGSAQASAAVNNSGLYLAVFTQGQFGSGGVGAIRFDPPVGVQDEDPLPLSVAFDDQFDPAVAWSGQEYLVTWANSRGVFASRVASDGAMMDPDPVEIWPRQGTSPDVVWAESHYLVVWEDWEGRSPSNIFAARVNRDGQVLDEKPIHVSETAVDEYAPQVASSGATALIVWEDARSTFRKWGVSGALMSQSGQLLQEDPLTIGAARDYQSTPSVAWNGSNYLVAWEDLRLREETRGDIFGSRVTRIGRVLDPRGIKISTARRWQERPSVAAAGNKFLVAWTDSRSDFCDVYAAIVSKRGGLRKRDIVVAAGPGCQSDPTTAQAGPNYLVTWSAFRPRLKDDSDLYTTRVDASGTVLDPEAIELATGPEEVWASTDAVPTVDRAVVVYSRLVPETLPEVFRAFIRTVR